MSPQEYGRRHAPDISTSSRYNRKNFPRPQHLGRAANLAHGKEPLADVLFDPFASNFRRVPAELRKKDNFSGTLTSATLTRHGNGRTWVVTAPGGRPHPRGRGTAQRRYREALIGPTRPTTLTRRNRGRQHVQRLLREVQGEARLPGHRGGVEDRHEHGEGQVPGLWHHREPDPREGQGLIHPAG